MDRVEKKSLLVTMPVDTFYRLHTLCGRLMAKERSKSVSWTTGICRAIDHAYDTLRETKNNES